MFKRFMRSKAVQMSLGLILAAYIQFVRFTTRWTIERQDEVQPLIDGEKGVIALTWHSRFLMWVALKRIAPQKPNILISLSRDGELVAYTAKFLGINTIRGSARKAGSQKSKGGSAALRQMNRAIENNEIIIMMPDGPRGPRQRLKSSALGFAKMTGAPIVPVTFSVKNRIQFKSWDRFVLPLPFGKGIIIFGTPVSVPEDANNDALENYKNQIEDEMNAFLKDADTRLGHEPVEPVDRTS